MSDISMFGRIHDLIKVKVATRLVFKCQFPYQTKYFKMMIWAEEKLKKDGISFAVGDYVQADCLYKKPFYNLKELHSRVFDTCPVCQQYLPTLYGQRTRSSRCESCVNIPDDQVKELLEKTLILKSLTYKKYQYGKGVVLNLLDSKSDLLYSGVIFENNPLYEHLHNLEEGLLYNVTGWVKKNTTFIDVLHCY